MPSGPHRRKSTKKKKKAKPDTNASRSRHGEGDDDQNNSPHPEINVKNSESSSSDSGYESLTPVTTQKSAKEKLSKIEIDKPQNSPKQDNFNIEKATIMELEPPTVADFLSQPFEFSPEIETQKPNDPGFKTPTFIDPVDPVDPFDQSLVEVGSELNNEINKPSNSEPLQPLETHKVEDLGFKTPVLADPVKSIDQSLVEVASQLNNDKNVQEKDELAAAETGLEENEVRKLESLKINENLLQDSINGKCPYCGRSGDDERQPLLALAPRPPEKASWKNCCGLFELFSGSTRN